MRSDVCSTQTPQVHFSGFERHLVYGRLKLHHSYGGISWHLALLITPTVVEELCQIPTIHARAPWITADDQQDARYTQGNFSPSIG